MTTRAKGITIGAFQSEEGQTLVEYALIIALISIAAVGVLIAMTNSISGVFNTLIAAL